MEVLKGIANTIYDCVQVTVDYLTNNVSDLDAYVKENQVVHEFYEKPCKPLKHWPNRSN